MKINSSCETIYGGIYLQSYTLFVFNIFIFSVFKYLVMQYLNYVVKAIVSKFSDNAEDKKYVDIVKSILLDLRSRTIESRSHNSDSIEASSTENNQPFQLDSNNDNLPGLSMESIIIDNKKVSWIEMTSTAVEPFHSLEQTATINPIVQETPIVRELQLVVTVNEQQLKNGDPLAVIENGNNISCGIPTRVRRKGVDSVAHGRFATLYNHNVSVIEENELFIGYIFVTLQFFSQLFVISVAFQNVNLKRNPWSEYENFYGFLLNSNVLQAMVPLITQMVRASWSEGRLQKKKGKLTNGRLRHPHVLAAVIGSYLIIFVPALCTHILPMVFLYFWEALLPLSVLFLGLKVVIPKYLHYVHGDDINFENINDLTKRFQAKNRFFFLYSFFLRFFVVLVFQTGFNYGHLLHGQFDSKVTPHNYFAVIRREYHLRSQTICNIRVFQGSLENKLVFFSWI
jgi:hypothetical protein